MMDIHLKQNLILACSVMVALALAVLALSRLIGSDEALAPAESEQAAANPAPPSRSAPETMIAFRDGDISFAASCEQSPANDQSYAVAITNLGADANDFVVEVRLSDSEDQKVSGVVHVAGLAPGEQRQIAVASEVVVVPPTVCSIAGVEIDRQVIRVN